MTRIISGLLVALGLCLSAWGAQAQSVVISQVYGGAGCGTANCSTYQNDYIELFNRSGSSVSVNGWSVQYSSATGTAWQVTSLPNVSIPAGGYLLVAQGFGANGVNVIPTPDVSGTINMSATAAKVALVNTTTALTGSCPTSASIVDLVGYGATASCNEGGANAPAPSTVNAIFRAAAGCTDTNNNGSDFAASTAAARNSATTAAPCGGGTVTLNISDVTQVEGDTGTTTFTFTVSLTQVAGTGGVTFDIGTADNTAQDGSVGGEDTDYVANVLTGQSIPSGSSSYSFSVSVEGDTSIEANETFFVNVTNVTGAVAGDVQGLGTITNDDVTLTPIHDVQGPGATSPIVGASVSVRGIVTGLKSNGFFVQAPDAEVDADPATSEAVFVFTSSAPPAAAVIGALVQVTGTVVEFSPSTDSLQPPLTEITSPTVIQVSVDNPLPAAIPLSSSFPDPAGPYDQLERLEAMRVSVASMTVTAPTSGNVSEANATATSDGVFYGVVTGNARPFREPGIQSPDPAPSGVSIPPVPRFDSNPENIRVDSNGQTGTSVLNVSTGTVVTGLVGPLDYGSRAYTILPDLTATLAVSGGSVAEGVSAATSGEFTVASYNLQRFYDTTNDAGGDVVLTSTAYDNRLAKASLAIRNSLRSPDIIGVVEMENLATLQALAARISADAIAASQADPEYDAYLVEGNDVGGIDVGFLVKTSTVGSAAAPRIEVVEVVQELAGSLLVNPDTSTSVLNDRPPLRLSAIVNDDSGASFPVTVIANHLRSLTDVSNEEAGSSGWSTTGARVRAKRQEQAEDLANLVQARQAANANEAIILLGDFNAFEFNDGLVDSMGVISGTPSPDNETAVPDDGVDLVNPDLDNLFDTVAAGQRYSYVFGGNAQNLDHLLVNGALVSATTARRIEHARINADFPETDRNDATTARRLSDHDPIVGFFRVAAFTSSDVSISVTDSAEPVQQGNELTYFITVANDGPDADNVTWTDVLPANLTFVSLDAPSGWSCTTPAVGANGTVSCTNANLGVANDIFTLVVDTDAVTPGTVLSNTVSLTAPSDTDATDDTAVATTTVSSSGGGGGSSADLSVTITDTPDPVEAGANLTYQITVTNSGPDSATSVSLSSSLSGATSFVSLAQASGWSCTTPSVGSSGSISCSVGSLANGAVSTFTLVVNIASTTSDGATVTNTVSVSATTDDGDGGDDAATATTTVANDNEPEPVAIPTLSEWALMMLGLLLATGAVVVIQRRRTVTVH